MKSLSFRVAAVMLVLGALLLIDSALKTRIDLSFVNGHEAPATLIFTEAIHEALIGIGVMLAALILALGGIATTLLEIRADMEKRHNQELVESIRAKRSSS